MELGLWGAKLAELILRLWRGRPAGALDAHDVSPNSSCKAQKTHCDEPKQRNMDMMASMSLHLNIFIVG